MTQYMNEVGRLAGFVLGNAETLIDDLRKCGHHLTADCLERRVADYHSANNALMDEKAECRRTVMAEAMEINGRLRP